MAEERVVLTAELKDQMSAPLANAEKKVAGFTKTVEDGAKKQAAAVDKSTAQIDGSLTRQSRLFSGMSGVIGRATDSSARMFSGMRSKIKSSLDGLPEYTRKQGERAGNGFADGLKKASALVATYFGAQMVGGFIAEAGRASDATDKFVSTMSFAGLDTSAITKAKDEAKAYADQTVYDLPTIQQTMAQLASNGVKGYGDITKAAGNLNAVAGGNAETFKSVARTLTQSAGAGKLMTEDWNMLADAIPGASGPLQNALREANAFEGNFRDAMAGGQISADEFQAAIMTLGNQPIAAEAAKSTKTFEGALGNLNATINSGLMRALDKIKPAATTAMTALSNGLGVAIDWTADAAQGLYDLLVKGDFHGALTRAFGWEEDSKAVDMLLKMRDMAIEVPGKLKDVADKIYEFRDPITVIVGLILTMFIPGWLNLGRIALVSAAQQKLAWMMVQGAAVQASLVHSWAVTKYIAGWALMGVVALLQGANVAKGWLIAMGPVGWVIGIVALLVGAFVWAYNNIGWFKDGVDAAMRFVGDVVRNVADWVVGAWNNVVNWFNSTLMPAVEAVGKFFHDAFWVIENYWNTKFIPALQALGQWFADVFTNLGNLARDLAAPFVAVFDWIARLLWNFATIVVALWLKLVDLWNGILQPALQALGDWFASIFTWIIDFAVRPLIDFFVNGFGMILDFWNLYFIPAMQAFGTWVGSIMTWIYETLIRPVIDFIVNGFRALVDFWNLTVIPGLQALGDFIGSIMTWIYETLIRPYIDLIVGAFTALTDFWNGVLMPAAQAVGDWFTITIGGAINGVKSFIDDIIKNFQTFITFIGDKLKPVIDGIKDTFETLGKIIGDVLGNIGKFANNPLGGIQDMLGVKKDGNGQGVMPSNSGGGVYAGGGVRFAGGGVLGGYAPGHDSILARLSPGESVLVPELTRAIGPQNIMAANAEASGGRPAGSGPTLTSGYSGGSSRGGGTITINAPVSIQVAANGDGSVDTDALRVAVEQAFEDILAEHNRRTY